MTKGAMHAIARKAIARNTGARGLRAILETLLRDAMYEVGQGYSGHQQQVTAHEPYYTCLAHTSGLSRGPLLFSAVCSFSSPAGV